MGLFLVEIPVDWVEQEPMEEVEMDINVIELKKKL